jgi:hypothetical protein
MCSALPLAAMPARVFLIRHAEKPTEGGNSLSLKGRERAAAYVPFFLETAELTSHGTPAAIYAPTSSQQDESQRAVETVQGLADKLKISINTKHARDSYKEMVDEIKADPTFKGKTVLICWDHTTIPEIARAFGALQTPARWPQDVYDRIWKLSFNTSGSRPMFQNTPQRLMYGDTSY